MKLSQLSLSDYNQLDSIPVINQDLSASGFTPTANTYYRHTGATTDTFTQGVIYLYDTAYHKLGESGGGTTLNRYTYANATYVAPNDATTLCKRITKILTGAKGKISILFYKENSTDINKQYVGSYCIQKDTDTDKQVVIMAIKATPNLEIIQYNFSLISNIGSFNTSYAADIKQGTNGLTGVFGTYSTLLPFEISYYNDTEIT